MSNVPLFNKNDFLIYICLKYSSRWLISADIYKTGIYLAGGGSMLRGLDDRISSKTKLPVHIAEDPLRAVARGTSIALKNIDKYQFLIKD